MFIKKHDNGIYEFSDFLAELTPTTADNLSDPGATYRVDVTADLRHLTADMHDPRAGGYRAGYITIRNSDYLIEAGAGFSQPVAHFVNGIETLCRRASNIMHGPKVPTDATAGTGS